MNLGDVVRVMDAVSRGDLSHRVHAEGAGDLGKLKNDINQSLEALAVSMRQIGENAQQVAGACHFETQAVRRIGGHQRRIPPERPDREPFERLRTSMITSRQHSSASQCVLLSSVTSERPQ